MSRFCFLLLMFDDIRPDAHDDLLMYLYCAREKEEIRIRCAAESPKKLGWALIAENPKGDMVRVRCKGKSLCTVK